MSFKDSLSNLLIVDDHPIVRIGIRGLLESRGMKHIHEADSAQEARALVEKHPIDFGIFDLSLAESDGLELIKDLRAAGHTFPVLVMSMHDERLYAERVLKAGGQGYIMKKGLASNLIAAIERVLDGHLFLSEAMKDHLLLRAAGRNTKDSGGISKLTDRELEVFQLIGQGIATRLIAERLHLSVKTIETHRSNIKKKLGLDNASELASAAARWFERQTLSG